PGRVPRLHRPRSLSADTRQDTRRGSLDLGFRPRRLPCAGGAPGGPRHGTGGRCRPGGRIAMTGTSALSGEPRMRSAGPAMIVVPCLNEAGHIASVIDRLAPSAERLDMTILVVDGGSRDGTREIVGGMAVANPRLHLLD